ncbi:hypothetical protein HPB48_015716 [Haemaphysalis longicornis]|uniref:Transposase n=1 Tax=Haemaphysalis longicornis TaxID=44386 RepID=A0A9J6F9F2_HAELO|nr:hypothetical protein HPB48_015716 [Haemaphysalis longicornis]
MRQQPKGPRPTFRCGACRKELSQENGAAVIGNPNAKPSFFASRDKCDRPNVKLSRAEILWVMYCMIQGFSGAATARLAHEHYKLRSEAMVYWRSRIREVAAEELKLRPRMGGPGEVVQVDETLYRGRRRAKKGVARSPGSVGGRHRLDEYRGVPPVQGKEAGQPDPGAAHPTERAARNHGVDGPVGCLPLRATAERRRRAHEADPPNGEP